MARPISLWHTLKSFSYWYKAKIALQDHQYFEMCLYLAGSVLSVYTGTSVSGGVHGVSGEHSPPPHPGVVPLLPQ